MIELNLWGVWGPQKLTSVVTQYTQYVSKEAKMQYTTLALASLLGAAAVVSAESQQRQVSAVAGHGHGPLRRPAAVVGSNDPTPLAAASHFTRALQDPVEDDHDHAHEGEDEDEDHAEGGEMEKLPEWMTTEGGEEEHEHHDDEHGEEHEDEDEHHDEDLETAVVEGDEDEHHDEHGEGEEEGKSKFSASLLAYISEA